MQDVSLVAAQFALGIALPWWLIRFHQRRLDAERLAATWNEASFRSAVVAFGPLCIPFHFAKAGFGPRRWHRGVRVALGFAVGIVWMVVVLIASSLVLSPFMPDAP